jgi:hypothetical protein
MTMLSTFIMIAHVYYYFLLNDVLKTTKIFLRHMNSDQMLFIYNNKRQF